MAFRFRKFKVFQDSTRLHKEIVLSTERFPGKYYYLKDQLLRASLSIVLNIAEGSSKQSSKDFNRFISISLGSVDETMACLVIARNLNLISESKFVYFEREYEQISKQLGGFSKFLKSN